MDFDFVQSKMEAINQKVSYMLNKSHLRDFQLLSREVAPEGVKPIARSVSWLIQQVITQNLKRYSQELGFSSIEVPQTKSLTNETYNDIEIWDTAVSFPKDPNKYYVNIKTCSSSNSRINKDDISKADKIVDWYRNNPDGIMLLLGVVVDFRENSLGFTGEVWVANYAWIPDIYVNPRNNNLQSSNYKHTSVRRTNEDFVTELRSALQIAFNKKTKKARSDAELFGTET